MTKRLGESVDSFEICERCGEEHKVKRRDRWYKSCKAHRSSLAGQGEYVPCRSIPPHGLVVCIKHGGGSKSSLKKSREMKAQAHAELRAREALSRIGAPIDVNPIDAMLGLISASAGHVQFYREQVEKLAKKNVDDLVYGLVSFTDKTGGEDWGTTTVEKAEVNAWLKLYNDERMRLADFISKASKMDIDERRIRLAESQGALVHKVIVGTLEAFLKRVVATYEIDMDEIRPDWALWTQRIVPDQLRALETGRPKEETSEA